MASSFDEVTLPFQCHRPGKNCWLQKALRYKVLGQSGGLRPGQLELLPWCWWLST